MVVHIFVWKPIITTLIFLILQRRRTDYVFNFFSQHKVVGLLNFRPLPETSSLLDFLFSDPPGKTAVIIVVVIIVGPLGQQ